MTGQGGDGSVSGASGDGRRSRVKKVKGVMAVGGRRGLANVAGVGMVTACRAGRRELQGCGDVGCELGCRRGGWLSRCLRRAGASGRRYRRCSGLQGQRQSELGRRRPIRQRPSSRNLGQHQGGSPTVPRNGRCPALPVATRRTISGRLCGVDVGLALLGARLLFQQFRYSGFYAFGASRYCYLGQQGV